MLEADAHPGAKTEPGWLWRLANRLGLTDWSFGRRRCWGNPHQCAHFTSAFVALAAKMAKADGVALAAEAETFEKFLDVSADELDNVRRLYAQAERDTAGFEAYADRIATMLESDPDTKRRVFECLFYVACSDGILHPAEDSFLHVVASRFGYDEHEFRAIRATFVHDPESPYAVLDIAPDATDRAIKVRYRKLVSDNHPDRLTAAGAPAAVIKAATVKVAAFNAAYDQIVE
nr:DnaJ family molecular chaperone [Alphaproteobacteria bacterium]